MTYFRACKQAIALLFFSGISCLPTYADSIIRFRDLRLQLVRVEANSPENPRDDAAVVTVRTATNYATLTIPTYSSRFIDEYEINVIYARANLERPGQGTARITVYGP